ncbi:MAG: (2Fe-2S)-binding protein [Chromatiales bacterium]|nr:MAG: (2Fe-2S)-binding protein [Chromatiales bacterium]
MPRITYIDQAGDRHELDLALGSTVMEGAIDNDVPGIVAECGGACACATCHVYVDNAWAGRLTPISDMEDAMLDSALSRQPTSRLSCQIEVADELDGLVVQVAPNDA